MDIVGVIFIILFCAVSSFFLYGMWAVENDRYNHREKHGIDPKYHGWEINDEDQNQ